jgi:hypothetical protein
VAPAACWGLGACCWPWGGEAVAGGGREEAQRVRGRVRPVDVLGTPPFQFARDHVPQYLRPPAPSGRALCTAEARLRATLALSEPWVARGLAPRWPPSASGGRRHRRFFRPKGKTLRVRPYHECL